MGSIELRIGGEKYVEFHPDPVAGVVSGDVLEALDDGAEAVGEVHELLDEVGFGCFSGEPGDVFEASGA